MCRCPQCYAGTQCQTCKILYFYNLKYLLYLDNYTYKDNNPCLYDPCQNGGTCNLTPNGNSFYCTCPSGYHGSFCQKCIFIRYNYETFFSINKNINEMPRRWMLK